MGLEHTIPSFLPFFFKIKKRLKSHDCTYYFSQLLGMMGNGFLKEENFIVLMFKEIEYP